jgi:long-chain acyl-CoA synthetase
VRDRLTGVRLFCIGGTGFLGKVWLSLVLYHFPEVGHIYLVVRERRRADGSLRQSSEARFWADVASSPVFEPLRKRYPGEAYKAFLRQKVTPVPGDVSEELCGVPASIRDHMRGQLDAFVNASGVVDFNPPLDEALNVNAFGMQNLCALAKDLSTAGRPHPFQTRSPSARNEFRRPERRPRGLSAGHRHRHAGRGSA